MTDPFTVPPAGAWVEVFLDDGAAPVARFQPPDTFRLDTTTLADGEHELRVVATDVGGHVGVERRRFRVRNGPGISISGLRDGETIKGTIPVLVNAYAFEKVAHFEVKRAETPVPIPRLYSVAAVAFFAWAAWYVLAYWHVPEAYSASYETGTVTVKDNTVREATAPAAAGRGAALFASNCAACHQASGLGVAAVFPPLKGNPVVLARDAKPLELVLLHGLQGKAIDGVAYPGQMPAFQAQLSDQDLADVATYVRTSWGNQGAPVTAGEFGAARH